MYLYVHTYCVYLYVYAYIHTCIESERERQRQREREERESARAYLGVEERQDVTLRGKHELDRQIRVEVFEDRRLVLNCYRMFLLY